MCEAYGSGVAVSAVLVRPDGTLVVTVRLTLKPGRDDDLIRLVQSAPRRGLSATVRESMRNGVIPQFISDAADDNDLELPDIGLDL